MPKANLASIGIDFPLSTDLGGTQEVHDDEDLLVLAERALVLVRAAQFQLDSWPVCASQQINWAHGERHSQLERELRALLRRASKLHAHTPAGVYAKARLVLSSRTGAAVLAKSLAADMIEMPGLRRLLWPAEAV